MIHRTAAPEFEGLLEQRAKKGPNFPHLFSVFRFFSAARSAFSAFCAESTIVRRTSTMPQRTACIVPTETARLREGPGLCGMDP
jgi:hypothetical protein